MQGHTVAVIGSGGLGSRHVQGIAALDLPVTLYVVDPNPEAISLTLERCSSLRPQRTSIVTMNNARKLPFQLDILIIATSADVRLAVLQECLEHSEIRFIILEKVAFQSAGQFQSAMRSLEKTSTSAWVNCPRRMTPFFSKVKNFLCEESPLQLSVLGSNWGLACNSIHFLDLFAYLTEEPIHEINTDLLSPQPIPSKRGGFCEIHGTLRGRSVSGGEVELTSVPSGSGLWLQIRGKSRSVTMDQMNLCASFLEREQELIIHDNIELPMQSQLSGVLCQQLLSQGRCSLTPISESFEIHRVFLDALGDFFRHAGYPNGLSPIT